MTFSFLVSIFITLSITTSLLAYHENPLSYWQSSYPNIPIPSVISNSFSKMSSKDVETVVSLIQNQSLSSNLGYFCKTAGLVCASGGPISTNSFEYAVKIKYQKNRSRSDYALYQGIFFRESALKNEAKFELGDLEQDISPAKAFLPHWIASLLTLEQSQVLFSKTDVGDMMQATIDMCNSITPQETKKCVSSVKELVEFPAEVFQDKSLKLFTPKSNVGSKTAVLLENIRPLLREIPDAKLVSCHELFFPYMVMYCHSTSSVQVYEVDLVHPETKEMLNEGMVAVCHRDTSYWDPKHVSFTLLKVRPGETEVCHWMSTANLAWVHLDDTVPR